MDSNMTGNRYNRSAQKQMHARMKQLLGSCTFGEMAETLNSEGFRTAKGGMLTAGALASQARTKVFQNKRRRRPARTASHDSEDYTPQKRVARQPVVYTSLIAEIVASDLSPQTKLKLLEPYLLGS